MRIYLIRDNTITEKQSEALSSSIIYLGPDKASAMLALKSISKDKSDSVSINIFNTINGRVTINA